MFLFRNGSINLFVALNLAVILVIGIFALNEQADPSAPVPGLIILLYLVFYLPAHLLAMTALWFIYRWRERRRLQRSS